MSDTWHDDAGRSKVFSSNKPVGTTTFYSGGDEHGHEIVFNMLATDASKSVDLQFDQIIYMIGGQVSYAGAPLGAHFSIECRIDLGGGSSTAVSSYGDKIFFLGTGGSQLVSQERDVIPPEVSPGVAFFLRLTVYNSSGTGEHDAPAAFKFCGNLFTYRAVTV